MLINRKTRKLSHHHVFDLPHLIPKNYSLIANNTKVFPARLLGHRPTGGKVEILLTEPLGHSSYRCISKPGLKTGDVILFPLAQGSDLTGTVLERNSRLQAEKGPRPRRGRTVPNGYERIIKFDQEESTLRTTLSQLGTMPTPPYIKKLLGNSADYQMIYAKYGFSAAAPTAGLHFTPALLSALKQTHPWLELTLNVGLGTFLPVKEDRVEDHHMHSESYTISPTTATQLQSYEPCNSSITSGGHPKQSYDPCKKLAIGTTTMRALESNVSRCHNVTAGSFSTDIFIYPPYRFQIVDALLTNFHLPASTLLMLVSAFCSAPNSKEKFTTFADSLLGRAYAEAISLNYRFFSFGDAMLII